MKNEYAIDLSHNFKNILKNDLQQHTDITNFNKRDASYINYRKNFYGYRSDEFDNNSNDKIMFLGCSMTYGVGLHENLLWTTRLAKKLDSDYVNLAYPGDSVMGQVKKAFAYFKNFGNPKIIFGLFPVMRMQFPSVHGKINNKKDALSGTSEPNYMIQNIHVLPTFFQKYAKAPYSLQEVLTTEIAIYMNHIFIYMLEQYCKSNNILLVWSFWEYFIYQEIYDKHKNDESEVYENFAELDFKEWDNLNFSKDSGDDPSKQVCHFEYKDQDLFHQAADTIELPNEVNGRAHWGWHKHIHISDGFYQYFINKHGSL